jgi:probable F420-dependent oxidoreductase
MVTARRLAGGAACPAAPEGRAGILGQCSVANMEIGLYGSAMPASPEQYHTIPFRVVAQEAEARGFDALFIGEHSHTPVDAVLPEWMGTVGGQPYPEFYRHYPDPYILLAQASALTSRIKLGVAISLVALHDPILLAKTISTLDHVCEGRLIFGVGYGYNEPEFRNHGIDLSRRRDIVREKVLAMEALWSQETAAFQGEHVSFTESWQYPKPYKRRRPPVLVGGQLVPKTLDHIAEWADGWLPAAMMAKGQLASEIAKLKDRFEAGGRDPDMLDITVFHTVGHLKERKWDYRADAPPITDELIANYEKMGVTRLCFPIPNEGTKAVIELLDDYARAMGHRLGSA